jgi:Nucleotide modification associated domain 1
MATVSENTKRIGVGSRMGGQQQRTGTDTSTSSQPMIGAAKKDPIEVTVEEWDRGDFESFAATFGAMAEDLPFEGLNGFEENVLDLFDKGAELLLSKHHDYGPTNISDAPGGPLNGLRVRIWDKIARINNLIDSNVNPEHESLRDSFIDLANYSMIAVMVIDKTWPGVE